MSTILEALRRVQRDRDRVSPSDLRESVTGDLYFATPKHRRTPWVLGGAAALLLGMLTALLLAGWDLETAGEPSVAALPTPESMPEPVPPPATVSPEPPAARQFAAVQPSAEPEPVFEPEPVSAPPAEEDLASSPGPQPRVQPPQRFGTITRSEPGPTGEGEPVSAADDPAVRPPAPPVPRVIPRESPLPEGPATLKQPPGSDAEAKRSAPVEAAEASPPVRHRTVPAKPQPAKAAAPASKPATPVAKSAPTPALPASADDETEAKAAAATAGATPGSDNPFLQPYEPITRVERLVPEKATPERAAPAPPPPRSEQAKAPRQPAPPPPSEPRREAASETSLALSGAFPMLTLEEVRWHPDPQRRMARLTVDDMRGVEVHEGEEIQGAVVNRIDPGAVELQVGQSRKRLRITP